jgi:hypothetical protein
MAQASASIDIPVPPDQVWQLIGGFNSLPDWLPYAHRSELSEGGRVRHLANANGETIIERLEAFDNDARSYSYHSPRPVSGHGLPIHAMRASDARRKELTREVVWPIRAQRREPSGGLSAVSELL